MLMWKRNLTAPRLAFATTVALAAAQDYQIVKVASVAGAAIDGLKPKTIFFTDHRIDETSDKGAFIRFEEWSRTRPNEAKFLNLFPSFKEGMVHKIIDGSKKEVKDELQMYVTEARFMLSRPAASVDLKTFATLPFIQSIDPTIKHEAIKPSDVSTLKDEKGQNNKNPDRALVRRHRRHRLHPLELQARRQAADRRRARQQAARQRDESCPTRSSSRARCGCCRRRMSTRPACRSSPASTRRSPACSSRTCSTSTR